MRRHSFLLVVCAVIGASCMAHGGQPARDPITEPYTAAQAEVRQVLTGILDAVEHKDLDRLESYHSYTPKFSKFEDDGLGRQDAAAGRTGERAIGDATAVAARMDDLKVDVFGDTAVATGILDFSVELGADKMAGKDRFTLVLVKTGGAWKIVHEHASPLAPAAPSP